MRVIKIKDVINVLELHLETPDAASIVLDLLEYVFIIEDNKN